MYILYYLLLLLLLLIFVCLVVVCVVTKTINIERAVLSLKSVVLNLFCRLCDVHLFISTHEREARNTHSVMRMVVCVTSNSAKLYNLRKAKV